jgi:hypothetical protein
MPAANNFSAGIFDWKSGNFVVSNQSAGRSLWLPNLGETELEGSPLDDMTAVPFTDLGMRGFTDRGRFFNTYNQNRDGAAATPAYSFASDINTGMYRGGSDDIRFSTGGTDKFKISDSVYSMGPSAGFVFHDRSTGLSNAFEWYANSATARLYNFNKSRDIMTVNEEGEVNMESNTPASSNLYYTLYSNTGTAGDRYGVQFRKARGTISSPTDAVSGDRAGVTGFWWRAGGSFVPGATIGSYADTISGSNLTTSIRFATANGAAFPTEKFFMLGNGDFEISSGAVYKVATSSGQTTSVTISGCTVNFTGGIMTSKSGC